MGFFHAHYDEIMCLVVGVATMVWIWFFVCFLPKD